MKGTRTKKKSFKIISLTKIRKINILNKQVKQAVLQAAEEEEEVQVEEEEVQVFDKRASEVLNELGLDIYLQSRIGGNRISLISRQTFMSRVLSFAQYVYDKVSNFFIIKTHPNNI